MKHLLNLPLVSLPSPFRRKKRSLVPWTVFSTTQSLFIIVQRCISFATRLCESTARGGESRVGSDFTISNKICYLIIGAWKKNRVLACALQCVVNISTISVRAWRTCIREFHSRNPLTFDFPLCASHLFCRNRRWPTHPTRVTALMFYHLRSKTNGR